MRGDNEGPTTIPAHKISVPERKTCNGCRYFDSHIVGNVCGGFGARVGPTTTECKHPDAMRYFDATKPGEQATLRLPDRGIPRVISRDAHGYHNGTPDWCPYLKKESSDASSVPSPAAR